MSVALRQAATVIMARATPQGFDVLMLKRSAKSPFMPDLYVYPGGVLDPADCVDELDVYVEGLSREDASKRLDEPHLGANESLGLYLAAVREVFEESGMLLARRCDEREAIDLEQSPEIIERFHGYRERLRRGELSMAKLCATESLIVDLSDVGYFARWVTPLVEKRRFDARFFVVRAPERQRAAADAFEVVEHLWASPSAILEKARRGDVALAPPTFSTLRRLDACGSIDEIMHHARTFAPLPLLPHVTPDTPGLLLPHHPDYPEDLRRTHLEPLWNQTCQDVPSWQAIRREGSSWKTL